MITKHEADHLCISHMQVSWDLILPSLSLLASQRLSRSLLGFASTHRCRLIRCCGVEGGAQGMLAHRIAAILWTYLKGEFNQMALPPQCHWTGSTDINHTVFLQHLNPIWSMKKSSEMILTRVCIRQPGRQRAWGLVYLVKYMEELKVPHHQTCFTK
jgi:hypothetical protein